MKNNFKKIFSGALATSLATGVVASIPMVASAASINDLYAAAYNATVTALKSGNQADINAARDAINALVGTDASFAVGEFSKQVDTVQQPILVTVYNSIAAAQATPSQANINAARATIDPALPAEFKNAYSEAIDVVEQGLITAANDAVNAAVASKNQTDIDAANAKLAELATSTNSDVTGWTSAMQEQLGTEIGVSVSSVAATSATTIAVTFNHAPADTSKVTFAVSESGAQVTVAPTWNADKTVATLTKSSNFTAGSYTVDVKNDTTDLGQSNVNVTEQEVAKINITSSKLGVTTDSNSVQTGYATYQVLDQYGNDITKSALADNITFQTGVGTVTPSKGLLEITPASGINLMTFASGIVITGSDSNTGVSTSATLTATSQVGTLSDISLSALTNADGKVLTAGDTTDLFYVGYTATDISGNPTTDYKLVKQGLMLGAGDTLTTSNPDVVAKLEQDPADSSKAVIVVTATSDAITVDMPIVITAMTWTGKTSQINATLKKQAAVDSFTLMMPSDSVASNESKAIPFAACDQNGNALTKASDLSGITFNNVVTSTDVNGNLVIKNAPITNSGTNSIPEVITAMTPTGHYSSITLNIQKAVSADSLALDSTKLKSVMQAPSAKTVVNGVVTAYNNDGPVQKADFGYDNGGLTVNDQYGRAMDMTTDAASKYAVVAVSSDPTVVGVSGLSNYRKE